jgi:hypothetical protein
VIHPVGVGEPASLVYLNGRPDEKDCDDEDKEAQQGDGGAQQVAELAWADPRQADGAKAWAWPSPWTRLLLHLEFDQRDAHWALWRLLSFAHSFAHRRLGGVTFALFPRETKFLVKKNNKSKKRFSSQKVESTF